MTPNQAQAPARPFRVAHDEATAAAAFRHAVIAIGNFDGVHRGHRTLTAAAIARARRLGCPAAALTFEPHTRAYVRPQEPLFRLTDECAKLRLLAATGLDGAIVMRFDAELAALSAQEFVRSVLADRLAVKGAAVGYDFHFGRDRGGSAESLAVEGEKHGFPVDIMPPLTEDGRAVSSSAIRDALKEGRVGDAAELLGYPWFVTQTVVHGDKRGRDLGYPTANLRLDTACALRHGIYAVRVGVGEKRYEAVASFGRRPTFGNGAVLLEVFLFDFTGDLYGQALDVAFIEWIRPELRFDTVEELIRRMHEDAAAARAALVRAPEAFPRLGSLSPPSPKQAH
ncbi:MAG TPA: bifunctional riboflavin kinase/FAD synthetase [Xanthobacteraceae bacterium]|nr:bifunctional riboflavin kinase/FAD synthetase [Xanthobacteraceae bacterium]